MKRTVGVMTVAVMLCAQTGAYAADQMSKERESGKPSGQSGQDMQRQSGQSGQPGQSGQDMQRQSSGEAGPSFSEEMQRQNKQIWQSGQQSQALCQKQGQPKQQAQTSKDQSQPMPEQSKQPQGQAGRDQDKQSVQEQSRPSGATQTIMGQFVRMEGDFYVIKDQGGKETCIPTSYGTFVDQTFSPGDTIAARVGQDGTALLIGRPSDRQTASSDVQGQEMSQATADQRGDRSFSGRQPGSQAQDSGARDQSKDKGPGGSQQAASVVKGELLKIQGEFYTVKDQSGSEVRLHVNKETKMEGAVNIGDKIEAERTSADHAISIKQSQDAGASRNR